MESTIVVQRLSDVVRWSEIPSLRILYKGGNKSMVRRRRSRKPLDVERVAEAAEVQVIKRRSTSGKIMRKFLVENFASSVEKKGTIQMNV